MHHAFYDLLQIRYIAVHTHDVSPQVVEPARFVLTEGTCEGPFVGVHALVFLKFGGEGESLVTVFTNMTLMSTVFHLCS